MKGTLDECLACNSRASCRSDTYGEMKAVSVIEHDKENKSETSPIRRIWDLSALLLQSLLLIPSHSEICGSRSYWGQEVWTYVFDSAGWVESKVLDH